MEDRQDVNVDENVVLSKFDGEALPENEFERVTISNGVVVSHEKVEDGEIVGPVENSDIVGTNIGRLTS